MPVIQPNGEQVFGTIGCSAGFARTNKNSPGLGPGLWMASSAYLAIGRLQKRCLLEEGQNALLRLVGLGQHGGGGLRDDLRLGQGGRLFGVVGVHDAAA